MTLYTRLLALIRSRLGDTSDPFEGFTDYTPEPPETPFHITLPGKYRPYVITSHADYPEAAATLELWAAAFAADHWFVYRENAGMWRLHKRIYGEDLISRLEIVSSEELAAEKASS